MLHRARDLLDPPAHTADQRAARPSGRIRPRGREGREGVQKLIAIVADERRSSSARADAAGLAGH